MKPDLKKAKEALGNGAHVAQCVAALREIIAALDPPAFDWDAVKPGMAFKSNCFGDVWFLCHHLVSKSTYCVTTCPEDCGSGTVYTTSKHDLKRTPEKDKYVT